MRALEQQNPLLQLNVLVHTRHSVQFNQILARLNPKFLLNLIEVTQFNAVTALLLHGKVTKYIFGAHHASIRMS